MSHIWSDLPKKIHLCIPNIIAPNILLPPSRLTLAKIGFLCNTMPKQTGPNLHGGGQVMFFLLTQAK